jgi:hypothetical protein
MSLWSFISDLFDLGSNSKKVDPDPVDPRDVGEPRDTVGNRVECCEAEPPGAAPSVPALRVSFEEEEAPSKMSSHEQKRMREERRKKVTDLKRRLLMASSELDDTLADIKGGPPQVDPA